VNVLERHPTHASCACLCIGLAVPNVVRVSLPLLAVAAFGLATLAALSPDVRVILAAALLVTGWIWGSLRLDSLDRSPLSSRIGTAERMRVVVTAEPRRGRFDVRAPALVVRFGSLDLHEPALLRLPLQRPPPQGAILDGIGEVLAPRRASNGFDQRAWLRRHGMHVLVRLDTWRMVGRRGGLGAVADRLRTWLARSVARGVRGERAAVLEGVVLGDDGGLSDELRQRFRASGLYHLLAVSGQNVALIAAGALGLAWLLGISRWLGEIGALLGIGGYVLAVGAQPSVIRAGIAGALGSLAWLSARMTDRWYFLLVGAAVLLAWNPYTVLDAGFELSFSAVVAIFVLFPRLRRVVEGYPVPSKLADVLVVSAVCGFATAPVLWLQFHAIPLLTIPANAFAAPAMLPLLGLALIGALLSPVAPGATVALAWVNGWLAAYLAACARIAGGLPGAQVRSPTVALLLLAGALLGAAYAYDRRGTRRRSEPTGG
jgi:competence protein ComEC